jgi:transcriptional regulator with XRE-family HTH domain
MLPARLAPFLAVTYLPHRMPDVNTSQMLGETIREIRELRGLSLRELAAAAGLHHNFLQRLETGKENPSARTLVALAAALQILPAELFRRFSSRVMKAIADDRSKR